MRIINFYLLSLTICVVLTSCIKNTKVSSIEDDFSSTEQYYKGDPSNFIESILTEKDQCYIKIRENWLSDLSRENGTSYQLYVTDEYFWLFNGGKIVKLVNAALLVEDSEKDRFIGTKDYLCYFVNARWAVFPLDEAKSKDWKEATTIIGDSLINEAKIKISELGNSHPIKLFIEKKTDDTTINEIYNLFSEYTSIVYSKRNGNMLDMMSDKAKNKLLAESQKTYNDYQNMGLFEEEDYIQSVYECKKILEKNGTQYYGVKQAIASAETGHRFYTLITEKFIVVKNNAKIYIVASDQLDLIDEVLDDNALSQLKAF